jgi:hypothetical protein
MVSFYAGLRAKEIAALRLGDVFNSDGHMRSKNMAKQQMVGFPHQLKSQRLGIIDLFSLMVLGIGAKADMQAQILILITFAQNYRSTLQVILYKISCATYRTAVPATTKQA